MVNSILQLAASVVGYLAAKGLDSLVGKWLAYFVIAFETKASETAKLAFSQTLDTIKANAPEKAQAWADWRNRAEKITPQPKDVV